MRAFIAIDIPDDLIAYLTPWCAALPKHLRIVPEKNLHLTLGFLGEVSEEVLHDLAAELTTLNAAPIPLEIIGAGTFGSGDTIRAVYAKVAPEPSLLKLQSDVMRAARRAKLALPHRKFVPHITLARQREAPADAMLDIWLREHLNRKLLPVFARRGAVYRSDLTGNGPVYTEVSDFTLGPDYSGLDWD